MFDLYTCIKILNKKFKKNKKCPLLTCRCWQAYFPLQGGQLWLLVSPTGSGKDGELFTKFCVTFYVCIYLDIFIYSHVHFDHQQYQDSLQYVYV